MSRCRFSLQLASGVLSHLSDYTGVSYLRDRLDLAAVPETRAEARPEEAPGGGWGMLKFREGALLYDHSASSVQHLDGIVAAVTKVRSSF